MAPKETDWEIKEGWGSGIMIGLGVISLFILGIFPQTFRFVLVNLPEMFEHLGQ
jgi:hypothetical protein